MTDFRRGWWSAVDSLPWPRRARLARVSRSTASNAPRVTERAGRARTIIIRGPGRRAVGGRARALDRQDDARGCPGDCVGEDAEKVAAYIYRVVLLQDRQGRNKFQLPRIELSRLTVRQYRNAVADLIGSFRGPGRWDDQRGLKGEYSEQGQAEAGRQRRRQLAESSRPRDSVSISARAARSPSKMRSRTSPRAGRELPCSWFPCGLQAVLAGVPGQLARVGAGAGDRRVRVPRQDRKRHASCGSTTWSGR